jgi:hypothetical protein
MRKDLLGAGWNVQDNRKHMLQSSSFEVHDWKKVHPSSIKGSLKPASTIMVKSH